MKTAQVKQPELKSPYPWFGGKSRIARTVWRWFGNVTNFVDPFLGSMAMFLGRPKPWSGTETANDADGFVVNFWRATQSDPDAVAHFANWPVFECDLHARHSWLNGKREEITSRLEGDPDWFDAKVAGWWVWGQCCWIGHGWCSGKGPWQSIVVEDGSRRLVKFAKDENINLDSGQGVNRQLIHLGDAGRGVNRQLIHLGNAGQGVNRQMSSLADYIRLLSDRVRHVRICCGDWSRVCTPAPTFVQGLTAVFLDPPYSNMADRSPDLYANDSMDVAHLVREWAIEQGENPLMRIALCGYEGEHEMPADWRIVQWKTKGGFGNQDSPSNINSTRERVWFSPHCLNPIGNSRQETLFN